MARHEGPRGAVLVCHATRRVDGRVIYVQRGFVRGAVRAIYERNRGLFRLVVVLLPLSLVLGYWLSRRMLRPLEALRQEALLRARAMDPSAPLSIEQGDEIGDVKQALNALLSAVAEQKLATEAIGAGHSHEAKNPDGSSITGPVIGRILNASGPNSSPIIEHSNPIAYKPVTLDT